MCGTVADFAVLMGRVFMFGGKRVAVIFEYCVDVAFHGEAVCTVFVIPVKVDAGIISDFLVGVGGVVILKDRAKMFGVAFLDILYA